METDRRLRTALLPYQPRLLHDVLDSIDLAVVVLDETSRVLAGNLAATRLLGIRRGRRADDVSVDSVVAITDAAGAELDATDYEVWQAVARSGAVVDVLVTYADGSVRELAATALTVGGDVPEAVVCRYADVTARRELERRAEAAADQAARAELGRTSAEQRVALLEELLVYLTTR